MGRHPRGGRAVRDPPQAAHAAGARLLHAPRVRHAHVRGRSVPAARVRPVERRRVRPVPGDAERRAAVDPRAAAHVPHRPRHRIVRAEHRRVRHALRRGPLRREGAPGHRCDHGRARDRADVLRPARHVRRAARVGDDGGRCAASPRVRDPLEARAHAPASRRRRGRGVRRRGPLVGTAARRVDLPPADPADAAACSRSTS